jgi:hypothetical protein
MKSIQTTLLSLAAMVFVQSAFCEHPDLSGSWQLDVAASTFGNLPRPDSGFLAIGTGAHKMLHMQVVMYGPVATGKIERTVESDWKIDDKYHPVVGGEPGEVLAKWDGSVLLGVRQTDAGPEETRLVLTVGEGTLMETIQSSQGTATLIWRRR